MRRSAVSFVGAGILAIEILLGVAYREAALTAIMTSLVIAVAACVAVVLARHGRARGAMERWVYGVGCAIVLLTLGGLAMGATPWGLPHGPAGRAPLIAIVPMLRGGGARWWVLIGAAVTILVAVAIRGRRRWTRKAVRGSILWFFAMVLLVLAGSVAVEGAMRAPTPGFTQLWTLRGTDTRSQTITIGIESAEPRRTVFTIEILTDGILDSRIDGITLAPGEHWETTINTPAALEGPGILEARLFRDGDPITIYRRTIVRP